MGNVLVTKVYAESPEKFEGNLRSIDKDSNRLQQSVIEFDVKRSEEVRPGMEKTEPAQAVPSRPSAPPLSDGDMGPGTYEDLHRKCKDIFPLCFDGAKLMIQKGLSQHFQVSHTLSLSPATNHYKFGATFVGTSQITPSESYPVVLGDTDLSGNVTGTMIHHFTNRLRGKFQGQTSKGKLSGAQGTLEYRGRLQHVSLTCANLDLVNGGGIFVAQYLRRLFPSFDVGAELLHQTSRQIPGGSISNLSFSGRYRGDSWVAAASLGKGGATLSYQQRVWDECQVGVEWETSLRGQESVASLGYQYDLEKAGVKFQASVDTNWTVGAVMEKKLAPLPFTLAVSGRINHAKAQSVFGIGLIVG